MVDKNGGTDPFERFLAGKNSNYILWNYSIEET
jgi:hypothetical protein